MIPGNWNNIEPIEAVRKHLPPGGYVVKIMEVIKDEGREFLRLNIDVEEGEFKGYFSDLAERFGYWPYDGQTVRSYKTSAAGFFAWFLKAVEMSNPGLVLKDPAGNVDETKLKGQLVGVLYGLEEYESNDGTVKTRLRVRAVMAADKIRAGDFTVPELKKIASKVQDPAVEVVDTTQPVPSGFDQLSEEVPF